MTDPKLEDPDCESFLADLRRQAADLEEVRDRAKGEGRHDAAEASRLLLAEIHTQIVAAEEERCPSR